MYKLGQYIPIDSPIHKLDPRVKILWIIVLSIFVLMADTYPQLLFSTALLPLIYISRLDVHHIINALRPMSIFLFLIFLMHALLSEGAPMPPFPDWKITITYEGLSQGTLVTWRFMLLLAFAAFLTMTTSPHELVMGLERLLRPLKIIKVPSHDIAIMVSIALRFVPAILEEMERIKMAQAARCADFRSARFKNRIKQIYFLILPVVMGSFRRADELTLAMEGRAYRRGYRTYMKELTITKPDFIAIIILLIFIIFQFLSGLKIFLYR